MALFALIGLLGGVLFGIVSPPKHEASTKLLVLSTAPSSESSLARTGEQDPAQRKAATFGDIVGSEAVLKPVADELNLGLTAADIEQMIVSNVSSKSATITLQVYADDGEIAARILTAVVDSLKRFATSQQSLIEDGSNSDFALQTLQETTVIESSSTTQMIIRIVGGTVIGLLLGLCVIILQSQFSSKIRFGTDFDPATREKLLTDRPFKLHETGASENAVGAAIEFIALSGKSNLLVLSSPTGSSVTAETVVKIAQTLESRGQSVAILNETDNDLRALGGGFSIDSANSLTGYQRQKDAPATPVVFQDPSSHKSGGSHWRSLVQAVEGITSQFDYVLAVTPGLLENPGGVLLAEAGAGLVVVVESKKVGRKEFATTQENLRRTDVRAAGVLLVVR